MISYVTGTVYAEGHPHRSRDVVFLPNTSSDYDGSPTISGTLRRSLSTARAGKWDSDASAASAALATELPTYFTLTP